MKIINLNSKPGHFKAWKNFYVVDLDNQITSLKDNIINFNPPYKVLDSLTEDSIQGQVWNGSMWESRWIINDTKLKYREGFYNNFSENAVLLLNEDGANCLKNDDNQPIDICILNERDKTNGLPIEYNLYIDKLNNVSFFKRTEEDQKPCYILDCNFKRTWFTLIGEENINIFKTSSYFSSITYSEEIDANPKILNFLAPNLFSNVNFWNEDFVDPEYLSFKLDFNPNYGLLQSGWYCFLNKKDNSSDYKQRLGSYFLLPIGNGSGFYVPTINSDGIKFQYKKNNVGTVNSFFTSFGLSKRYIKETSIHIDTTLLSYLNYVLLTINSINTQQQLQIPCFNSTDGWFGYTDDMTYEIINDKYEEIIADTRYIVSDMNTINTIAKNYRILGPKIEIPQIKTILY